MPGYEIGINSNDVAQVRSILLPCRIDLSLPGAPHRLLPIPLARVYSIEDRRFLTDCFDVLNYTVDLLLETASHLSPIEREKLGDATFFFVHPESGLVIHSSRSFANFAFECILAEHNSNCPLVLSPSWPSVYFDEDGYPFFCEIDVSPQPGKAEPTAHLPKNQTTHAIHPVETSLVGEELLELEETQNANNAYRDQQFPRAQAGNQIRPNPDTTYHQQQLQHGPTGNQIPPEYVKKSKKRRHISLETPPVEWITLTLPRL